MEIKQLSASASFPSPAFSRERRDMRDHLERMERMFQDVQAQKEQVLARASLWTPGRLTPARRATDPGASPSLRLRASLPASPSVLRRPPRHSDQAGAGGAGRAGELVAGLAAAAVPPLAGQSARRRSLTAVDWAAAAAARPQPPSRHSSRQATLGEELPATRPCFVAAAAASRSPSGPQGGSGSGAAVTSPSRIPRQPGGASQQPVAAGNTSPLRARPPQPPAAAAAQATPGSDSYTGFAQGLLQRRFNPLREGLQQLLVSGSGPVAAAQRAADGGASTSGSSKLAVSGPAMLGSAPAASLAQPQIEEAAQASMQWDGVLLPPTATDSPRLPCARGWSPAAAGTGGRMQEPLADDDMLMASPVTGAALKPAAGWRLNPPGQAAPPPQGQHRQQGPGLGWQGSTPQRGAQPATGALPTPGSAWACTTPASAVSAALTTPDRDQQYSPSVLRPAAQRGAAGAQPGAAGAAAVAAGKSATPARRTQYCINSAFSPGPCISPRPAEGGLDAAAPLEAAAGAGVQRGEAAQGLAPLRLAFGGASQGSSPAKAPQEEAAAEPSVAAEAPHQQPSPSRPVAAGAASSTAGVAQPQGHCPAAPAEQALPAGTGGCAAEEQCCVAALATPAEGTGVSSATFPNAPEPASGAAPGSSTAAVSGPDTALPQEQAGPAHQASLVRVQQQAQPPQRQSQAPTQQAQAPQPPPQQLQHQPGQGGGEGSAGPASAACRLAALARLKCRSLQRQQTAVQQAAQGAQDSAASTAAQPAASASPPAAPAGQEDTSLAALKLRRRLSRCATASSPGALGPDPAGGAAWEEGVEGEGGDEAGGGRIAAHRPGGARRWDSAVSLQASSGAAAAAAADVLCQGSSLGGIAEGAEWVQPPSSGGGSPQEREAGGASPRAQPKPFLRRRSQSVVAHKLPDWSQVRPRTDCRLDSNLHPSSRCATPSGESPLTGAAGGTPGGCRPATPLALPLAAMQQQKLRGPAAALGSRLPTTPVLGASAPPRGATAYAAVRPTASSSRASTPQAAAPAGARRPATTPTARPPWGSGRSMPTPKHKAAAAAAAASAAAARGRGGGSSSGRQHSARTRPFSPGHSAASGPGVRGRAQPQLYEAASLLAGGGPLEALPLAWGPIGPAGSSSKPRGLEGYAAADMWQQGSGGQGLHGGEAGRRQGGGAAPAAAAGAQAMGPLDDLLGQVDRLLSDLGLLST